MNLKDIEIRGSYTGKGEKILNDFLLPSLNVAKKYDRIAGYFSVVISIANGIDSLRKKDGEMRLIVGVHSLPNELVEVTLRKDELKKEVAKIYAEIEAEIQSLSDLLEKKKIATLAWLIDDGLLTVKVAAVQGEGIFHPKTIIIGDKDNNEVVAVGSSNETRNGLGGNFEQLMVATSWNNIDAVNDQKNFFDSLWNNNDDDAVVVDITEETVTMIKKSLGNEYEYLKKSLSFTVNDVLGSLANMPLNFFVSGDIPSLYMHQERAVIDALSRWPVRVLFSDEVGLGKTFEAAATITFLNKYCNIERIIILTPKSVLKQWQDELKTHFGLDVWLYNSSKREYVSPDDKIIRIGNRNPLGYGSPNLILMSSQYARGNKNSKGLLSERDTILPQLLVVDEAHSARISEDLAGNSKKTQMYKMLENISKKIPHIILATATPMQKKAVEYHAMLKLLGLPKIWEKEKNFMDSLRFIMSNHIGDLSDANEIVALLHYTNIKMSPNLSVLTSEERALLNQVEALYENRDNFDKANFVKKEWSSLKNLFIKLHPARLLTIRNTRRSLLEVGYKFPHRNLYEKSLNETDRVKFFYASVNKYLSEECFSVEKELNPKRKLNISFVRTSYQQRVASSLFSCKMSLERRMSKIKEIENQLKLNNSLLTNNLYTSDIDDFDIDDLLNLDTERYDTTSYSPINFNNLQRAINKEYLSLYSLVLEVNEILKLEGDKKIDESINLALKVLEGGDSILLFSRYTDTVESLIRRFDTKNNDFSYNYAIYTGDKSVIVLNGIEEDCDKNQIKKALFSKNIRIVFCSDAASEGLNLQAARVLINVDVPWTPSRLEQRIGRVARLGQMADEVDIYNIWYPNSVESKMYHRIHKRLNDANIAIGEFPEVIAENIKNAILHDEDDQSLQMLKNIRNDMQKEALDQLWSNNDDCLTQSDVIRRKLINLCEKEYRLLNKDEMNRNYFFELNNKNSIKLTDLSGQRESINLQSDLILNIKRTIYGLKLKKNNQYNICLIDVNTNRIVQTESILDHLINNNLKDYLYYDGYPVTLANPKRLDLSYAIENYNNPAPDFWGEKNDNDEQN